eukprot:Gb_13303 [translate_table: standard]
MATMELASCIPQRYHHTRYYKFVHKRCLVVNAGAVEGQPSQVPRWESQGNNTKSPVGSNVEAYASLLQACTNVMGLKQVQACILINGLDQNIFLGTKLVTMYAMFASLKYARLVFDKICKRNVLLWNAMIREYGRNGFDEEALRLYHQMQQAGIQPNNFTFPFVLKACAGLSALQEGKEIHYHIVESGIESDVFVAAALIDMYGKCGSPLDARQVFDIMPTKDLVSWNAMIAGYAQNGHTNEALALFNEMQLTDVKPNSVTMVNLLSACAHLGALQQGNWIHNRLIKSGLDSNVFVGTSLIDMYAKHGSVEHACRVFDRMSERTVVSWNAMIAGYAQNGYANEALSIFNKMQLADLKLNSVTVVAALLACAHSGAVQQGKLIHSYIMRSGFESNVFVGNALIDMYAKCGNIENARHVFDEMSRRDVVSWTAMISGYVQNGHDNEALAHFHRMQLAGVMPDLVTLVSVLSTCARLRALQQGKWVHDCIIRSGIEADVFVGNALVDMYAKCASIDFARQLFNKMTKRNVVSWSAMIAGYAQNGHAKEALTVFNQMQLADMKPNSITMVSVLSSYAQLGALQQGKWIHDYIIRSGFESDVFVGTALIDMYAKCGSIEIARQMFDKMSKRNVVSWNAMIAGYGMHGHGEEALQIFLKMQQACIEPNYITFISVLSACSHAGLVDEGWQYFNSITRDYCIKPRVKHYACMVDLLGRAGRLDEAQDFIKRMPLEPDAGVWGALLGACRIHCNIELGERVAECLFNLQPENAGYYVLLSNIYAAAGRWDDVAKMRTLMKDRGLNKKAGCSLIEVNGKIHAFLVGDRSHPQSEKIYAMLETLSRQMKNAGYVPHTNFVLHDVEEEVKKHMLYSHSEKLAIAFGLISTSPGTPIWITKNLRVCVDCHIATKFISKIVKRKIIVRDANRFHHFKDGLCSCGDYW